MCTHTILEFSPTVRTSIAMLIVKHIQFAAVSMCHFLHNYPTFACFILLYRHEKIFETRWGLRCCYHPGKLLDIRLQLRESRWFWQVRPSRPFQQGVVVSTRRRWYINSWKKLLLQKYDSIIVTFFHDCKGNTPNRNQTTQLWKSRVSFLSHSDIKQALKRDVSALVFLCCLKLWVLTTFWLPAMISWKVK